MRIRAWHRSLAASVMLVLSAAIHAQGGADIWVTSADARQRLTRLAPIPSNPTFPAGLLIHVDTTRLLQPVEGFGASFTESSSWLMRRRMSDAQRRELMRELFDPETGLGLGVTRVPLGASDFSISHGTYDDMPAGQTDPGMAHFSIERARGEVLPLLREALNINPSLKVFISPWSAPAWMKTNGSLITGRLDPAHYGSFAAYFDKTLAAFKAEGVPVYGMTLQNEPHFEPGDYPGMRMEPAERAAFISGHLGPMLKSKWSQVKLYDWDHNWDQPESPLAVLADAKARQYVAGVAWHCYGGDVSAQGPVHDQYPELETWMTECSGGDWEPDFNDSLSWMMQNLIIGNLRHWGRGAILWNLALDEHSGPHLGGCGNCRGVVTIVNETGAVARNVEYYVLGHASRFVRPGARRIESDSGIDGLNTAAFLNAGQGKHHGKAVLLVVNTATEARTFSVVSGKQSFTTTLQAGSVATLTWTPAVRGN